MASQQDDVGQLQLQGTPSGSAHEVPESTFRPERRKEAPWVLGSGVVEDDLMFRVGEIQVPLNEFQVGKNVSFNRPTLPPSRMGSSSRPGTALAGRPRSAQLSRSGSRAIVDDDDLDVEIQQVDVNNGNRVTYDSVIDPANRATLPCTARARAAAEAGNWPRAWSSRPSSALGAHGRVTPGVLMKTLSGRGWQPTRDRHDSAPKLMEEENQMLLKEIASSRPASRVSVALPPAPDAVQAELATRSLAPPVPPNCQAVEHARVDSEDSGSGSCSSSGDSDSESDSDSDSDSDDPPLTRAVIPGEAPCAAQVSRSRQQALPQSMTFLSSIRRVVRSADQTSRPGTPSTPQGGHKSSELEELAPQVLHVSAGSQAVDSIDHAGYPSQGMLEGKTQHHARQASAKQKVAVPLPLAPHLFKDALMTQSVCQQSTRQPVTGHDMDPHSEEAGLPEHSQPAAGSADFGESTHRPPCTSQSKPFKIRRSARGHNIAPSPAVTLGDLPSIQECLHKKSKKKRRQNMPSLDEPGFQGARRGSASDKTGHSATSDSLPSRMSANWTADSLPHFLSTASSESSVEKPASRTATPRFYVSTDADGSSIVAARRRNVERLLPLDHARRPGSASTNQPDFAPSSDCRGLLVSKTQSAPPRASADSANFRSPTTLMNSMPRPCGGGALAALELPALSQQPDSGVSPDGRPIVDSELQPTPRAR